MSLFAELKRRNVLRVAAAYGVSSWLLIEIASLLFEAFDFPNWGLQMLITLLALGLIPALLFSWAYEITPQGLRRESEVDRTQSISRMTGRRLDQVTIVMILLALAVVAGQRFIEIPGQTVATRPEPTPTPVQTAAPPELSKPDLGPAPERESVAVLPFVNMSSEKENEYFSDGISEEILNVLARIDGLKVASRTSSFSYKGREVAIPEIAGELGVAHVLEGSVRKQGQRVRITAQLIQASDGFHLWSDTFDRELTDIFAVQEEIAQRIVDALSAALGTRTVVLNAPTQNLEAYQQYLRGRQLWLERFDSIPASVAALEKAVELDPRFARAWSTLGGAYAVAEDYGEWWPRAESERLARGAATRAIELDPDLAEPYAVLGLMTSNTGQFVEAARWFDQALERDPRDSVALLWRGTMLLRVGHIQAARQTLETAFHLDPMVGIINGYLSLAYELSAQRELAIARHQRAAELGWIASHLFRIGPALGEADREAAKAHWLAGAARLDADSRNALLLAIDDPAAIEDYVRLTDEAVLDSTWFTRISGLRALGQNVGLLDAWERLLDGGLSSDVTLNLWREAHRPLIESPRMFAIADRAGLVDFWDVHGYPDGCERGDDHLRCTGLAP